MRLVGNLCVVMLALSGPAGAQAPSPNIVTGVYESIDACLKHAASLGQTADERGLPEDRLEDIDDLLLRMETHCDARQFIEAATLAGDIAAEIAKP